MFIDASLQFHDDTAVTSAAEYKGDAYALAETNLMDREGNGEPMEVVIQITDTFEGGTSAEFEVITGAGSDLDPDTTQVTTGAIPTAQLTEGATFKLPLVRAISDADGTHLGLMCTSLGTHTDGTFSAWLQRSNENQADRSYPDNTN